MHLEYSANSQQATVIKEGEQRASVHKVKSLKVHDKKKNVKSLHRDREQSLEKE